MRKNAALRARIARRFTLSREGAAKFARHLRLIQRGFAALLRPLREDTYLQGSWSYTSERSMQELPANLEARLRAIEFLVVNMHGIGTRRRGWDADRMSQEHSELLSRMSGKPTIRCRVRPLLFNVLPAAALYWLLP